jgi:hypothetical protein
MALCACVDFRGSLDIGVGELAAFVVVGMTV